MNNIIKSLDEENDGVVEKMICKLECMEYGLTDDQAREVYFRLKNFLEELFKFLEK